VGAAASIAAAAAVASTLAFGGGDGTSPAVKHVPSSAAPVATPSPETQRYIQWVESATPEELAAVYGGQGLKPDRPSLKPAASTR
jgi:hypothetical protein